MRLLALLVITLSIGGCTPSRPAENYVLLISFDGFRYDYVDKYDLGNFKKFIAEGAASDGLMPSFPSKTFPSHYTIVTGLYPKNHGLVDNSFYDARRNKYYSMHDSASVHDSLFYQGTTLWHLAQQQGLRTASFFWVGTEAPPHPSMYFDYTEGIDNDTRVAQVFEWLRLPAEERPRLIMLYFSLVDHAGHDYGPNSPELKHAVLTADSLVGRIMDGLKNLPIQVNTIITSDHGMTEIAKDSASYVILPDLLVGMDSTIKIVNGGTQTHIYCDDCDSLFNQLKSAEAGNHFRVIRREEFPASWNYDTPLAGNLMIVANPGHYIISSRRVLERLSESKGEKYGVHGFDSEEVKDMQGIFYANGPNIAAGTRIPPIKNVDVYPLVAELLRLKSPPIDGNLESTRSILK